MSILGHILYMPGPSHKIHLLKNIKKKVNLMKMGNEYEISKFKYFKLRTVAQTTVKSIIF